ncbi:MAG: hypothetical protein CR997_05675 [Acidobacteria bacterium]|nr:MAG: hypothetical protein CR997_05675 [Acidobacteriota bacterium]
MTLPELAIRRPVTAFVLLISIFVFGAIALTRLPLAFMPEYERKSLYIVVDYPNASPKIVERLIIRPIEEALSPMNGVTHMRSYSNAGGGRVVLRFAFDTSMDMARTEIRERLDRMKDELPEDMERITISSNWDASISGEAILEGRISSGRDLSKDYELLKRKIMKPIERIPGVASVQLDGVNPREIKINLDLHAIKRHQMDIRNVLTALNGNNLDQSLGVVRTAEYRFALRTKGSFSTLEELEELPINSKGLKLRDIASVTYREPPLEYGRHLDGSFAVGLHVSQESAANTVEVCSAIRKRVAQMNEDPELEGIHFLLWEDQGREIEKSIHDLEKTGFMGALLACIILFFFLKKISSTMIAVFCIPLSLLVACGVIWSMGKSLNTLSLLGLIVGIGMLVDNAVVMMENIVRYQQKGLRSRFAALVGSREVSVAVMAATFTSVIVFLPMIFSKPSEMNVALRELALTVCYTLLASLFISQTLIPLCMSQLPKQRKKSGTGRLMRALQGVYSKILKWTLRHRVIAPVAGLVVIASAYFPFKNINFNFEANSSEMFIQLEYRFSENLSLERKEGVITRVEKALDRIKEPCKIDSIYSYWSDRHTLTRLYLEDGFAHEKHMDSVKRVLPRMLPDIPGVKIRLKDNGRFWQRNSGKRISFRLEGPDTEVLCELADEALELIEQVEGMFDFYSTAEGGRTELHSIINREKARAYNVHAGQASQLVELTFRGRRLPRFKDGDTEVDMRLALDEREIESLDQLKNLPLIRSGLPNVPLESLSDFVEVKTPDSIRRTDKVAGIWVGGKFEHGDKDTYRRKMVQALEQMTLPYGYHWDFQWRNKSAEESKKEFITNLLLALGLIFAVMAAVFESTKQAVSLMISLPFAAAGAMWMLFILKTDFDQPASIGLLLLLGIVVNNGIVMVEHINLYRRKGMKREEAMIKGGRERFRPVLMTALTTFIGLLPIAIDKPAMAGVYYYSMAYVMMGGLLVSTVLTTVLLPSTICITEDVFSLIKRSAHFLVKEMVRLVFISRGA